MPLPPRGSTFPLMDMEEFRDHCLALPGVEETTPFGPDVFVYKVAGKMFALATYDALPNRPQLAPCRINLKCDPDRSLALRDQYEAITPGYHMNKRHWNTLDLLGHLPTELVRDLIDHSYQLVLASLPRKRRKTSL